MSQQQSEAKKDLKWFVKENYQLLTTMGVFGGLTALFVRLENASYLTLLSFLMFLVLSIEFWRSFPKTFQSTYSLFVFENLSLALICSVAVYILAYYLMDFVVYLPFLIMVTVGFLLLTSLRVVIAFFQRHKNTLATILLILVVASITFFILNTILYFLGLSK